MDIILYLLQLIQQLYQQNCFLINFICKYIPLKQWSYVKKKYKLNVTIFLYA